MRPVSIEAVAQRFLWQSGVHILGAGASAGIVPFGSDLYANVGLAWLSRGHYPAVRRTSERRPTKLLLGGGTALAIDRFFDGRVPRNIEEVRIWKSVLDLMPNTFAELSLMHNLARASFGNLVPDNYRVFQRFCASVVLSYNLDGLTDCCGVQHRVLTPHNTVPLGYGAPEMANWLRNAIAIPDVNPAREMNLVFFDKEEEPFYLDFATLIARANFVAITGYSFGRNGGGYDDQISLEQLIRALRKNPKPVFILDPEPRDLSECLAESIKSKEVFPVTAYWQFFAKAVLDPNRASRSIGDHYLWLLDR